MDSIGVLYSCGACGIIKAEVAVRYRQPDEDVVVWVRDVMTPALGADHFQRSPHCHPETLSEVHIPMPDGTQIVGGPVVQ